jgi:hypothetical protein
MSSIGLSPEPLNAVLKPWYSALSDPVSAQKILLKSLLEGYCITDYGKRYNVLPSMNLEEYQTKFPITNYVSLKPEIQQVSKGHYQALLPEPAIAWVMTRGTTGPAKILPITQKHLFQILTCGARAISNYIIRSKRFDVFQGKVLNLNFPSRSGTIGNGANVESYGHSSGTYARYNPSFAGLDLVPHQEEIDALGGGLTIKDWGRRFELTYQLTRNENIEVCMGVAPVIVSFAKYLKAKHHVIPKDFWKVQAIFCTSVPKIHWKYEPILKYFFGDTDVVEMYTATEGVFAQQLDNLPYIAPNYDSYLFEVKMGSRIKMLYEMKRGEWGRLIVSSVMLPRYDMSDMVECMGGQYFRVFGRARKLIILEHIIYRSYTRWFD